MIPPDDELLLAMFILKGGAWKEQSTDAPQLRSTEAIHWAGVAPGIVTRSAR
jgi:hypothetical protein